jgi:hypothetical protein
MSYLVTAALRRTALEGQDERPRRPRDFRRFNLPVQLALAAAEDIVPAAEDPATMAVVSLAPCHNGSPELYRWVQNADTARSRGASAQARMNPTHTLHVIDNLALSAFAIAHGSDGYYLGVGGAPGQAWCGLEAVRERLDGGLEREALLMAGDQGGAGDAPNSSGVALLFSVRRTAYAPLGRPVELLAIERSRRPGPQPVSAHAAEGLCGLLRAVAQHGVGQLAYEVPPQHTDGVDRVTVMLRVT